MTPDDSHTLTKYVALNQHPNKLTAFIDIPAYQLFNASV
jgi:hypothetical protein